MFYHLTFLPNHSFLPCFCCTQHHALLPSPMCVVPSPLLPSNNSVQISAGRWVPKTEFSDYRAEMMKIYIEIYISFLLASNLFEMLSRAVLDNTQYAPSLLLHNYMKNKQICNISSFALQHQMLNRRFLNNAVIGHSVYALKCLSVFQQSFLSLKYF